MSFQTMTHPLDAKKNNSNNNNNNNNNGDFDFLDGGNDILDEFLDQRVYEANDTPGLSDAFMKESGPFELRLEPDSNYNLDVGSFYQPSPDYVDKLNFHSPEGISPQNPSTQYNHDHHQEVDQNQNQSQSQSQNQNQNQIQNQSAHSAINHLDGNGKESHNLLLPSFDNTTVGDLSERTSGSSGISPYDYARSELAKLKFGFPDSPPTPSNTVCPPEYLDFSPEKMASLPCKLELSNLPNCSRVETQIKIKFSISPPPPSFLLHVPQDLISKSKLCLKDSVHNLLEEFKKNILFLDTFVLTSDLKKSCTICPRCIKREQKRASRRKSGAYTENSSNAIKEEDSPKPSIANSWNDENMSKKAIIYNCKEIVSFPPPTGLYNELSKSLELLVRIVCYCRHHKEAKGFKLLFVVKNYKGEVIAKNITTPIMIMDRKKTTSGKTVVDSMANSVASSSTNLVADSAAASASAAAQAQAQAQHDSTVNASTGALLPLIVGEDISLDIHALSPNSFDGESNTDPTNTDTNNEDRGLKRKKLSVDDSFNTSSNPMFNGSSNNFSPISNSDTNTNTSTHNFYTKQSSISNNPNLLGVFPPQQSVAMLQVPSIQRIIPAQGPIRGGIEVTLLGFNFRPGLIVKFGANQALATHCWSETTIVTYLPPATQPGQVLVSFENETIVGTIQQQQVFTYTDDTDRQLIELALQIVGLKMNGKLEDAKNIAKRIVGTDERQGGGQQQQQPQNTVQHGTGATDAVEWFDNAHKAVEILTKSDLSTEDILINFLSLVDLPNCPIILLNWQLCTKEGQTLLHLATLKNYTNLIRFLITHGCKVDVKDNQGLTPLFFASMCGNRELISIFLECKSNYNLKLSNDKHLIDYCDSNVLDIFNDLSDDNEDFAKNLEKGEYFDEKLVLSKSMSLDSLNSMFAMSFGRRISRMVLEEEKESNNGNGSGFEERHMVRKEIKSRDLPHLMMTAMIQVSLLIVNSNRTTKTMMMITMKIILTVHSTLDWKEVLPLLVFPMLVVKMQVYGKELRMYLIIAKMRLNYHRMTIYSHLVDKSVVVEIVEHHQPRLLKLKLKEIRDLKLIIIKVSVPNNLLPLEMKIVVSPQTLLMI